MDARTLTLGGFTAAGAGHDDGHSYDGGGCPTDRSTYTQGRPVTPQLSALTRLFHRSPTNEKHVFPSVKP